MKRYLIILLTLFSIAMPSHAEVDVPEIIFGHLQDSYEWHIAGHVAIPLPCIVYSNDKGLDVFLSNKLEGGEEYNGYHIDAESGKIVYPKEVKAADGTSTVEMVRPLDFSITKDVLEIFIICIVLCSVILFVANWYKKNGYKKAPGGFVGMMEVVIDYVNKEIIKPGIGHGYERFSPYLLTVFLFILTCNLIGLIPIFPGGANVTGNIAVTMVLAITSWVAINFFAPKHYFKEIFWPDVPIALKAIPLMPTIEFIGVFTKPFSLTIRLFANIMAGHIIILSLTSIIFIAWENGPVMGGSMTIVSVAFCIFMNCLELLVAFIQAYVFTILTANFIGLAQNHE